MGQAPTVMSLFSGCGGMDLGFKEGKGVRSQHLTLKLDMSNVET